MTDRTHSLARFPARRGGPTPPGGAEGSTGCGRWMPRAPAARGAAVVAGALAAVAVLAVHASAAPPDIGPMAQYQLALIRRGPSWTPGRSAAADSLQAGHMANIQRMAEARKLVAAGPFTDGGDLRGIYVFKVDSTEAAHLAADDPAVRAGRLTLEFHPLYTRAGLGEPYFRLRQTDPRAADSMTIRTFGLLKVAKGRASIPDAEIAALQEPHLWHIRNGMSEGSLALAGPLLSRGPLRGIVVFNGDSTVARAWAAEDPLVKRGALELEIHPWYSAAFLIDPMKD